MAHRDFGVAVEKILGPRSNLLEIKSINNFSDKHTFCKKSACRSLTSQMIGALKILSGIGAVEESGNSGIIHPSSYLLNEVMRICKYELKGPIHKISLTQPRQ